MSTTDAPAPAAQPEPTAIEKRLDRIEAAIASALGINLAHHDDQQVVAARKQRLAEAADKAAELLKAAFVEEAPSVEQRIARLEEFFKSRGGL